MILNVCCYVGLKRSSLLLMIFPNASIAALLRLSIFLICWLQSPFELTNEAKYLTFFGISTVYVKLVYFFCSHDFCLLDVEMESCFGTSFTLSCLKSLLLSSRKIVSPGDLTLWIFLPPVFILPSSESSPVYHICSAYRLNK